MIHPEIHHPPTFVVIRLIYMLLINKFYWLLNPRELLHLSEYKKFIS